MPFDLLPRAMPPSEIMADGDGERLDVFVARRLPPLSRTAARRLINEGLVLVEGGLERPSYRLRAGEMVRVQAEPATAVMVAEPVDIPLDVRYEDADLIVLNKPAGLTVHPAPGEREPTLVNALLAHCPDLQQIGDALRPGLVHRLDKDTSGVMMVAKHAVSLQRLQDQIRARSVEKRYLAVVAGTPDPLQGRVEAPVGRDRSDPRRMAVVEGGKPSTTEYRVDERFTDTSLLDCHLIHRPARIRSACTCRRWAIPSSATRSTGTPRTSSAGRPCTPACSPSTTPPAGPASGSTSPPRPTSSPCSTPCADRRRCMERVSAVPWTRPPCRSPAGRPRVTSDGASRAIALGTSASRTVSSG